MPGAAMQHSEVARNLASLPQTSRALASGDIGFHHAAVIARSVTEVGADAVVEEEARLVKAAHNLDPKYLSYLTRRLRYSIDPEERLRTPTTSTTTGTCISARRSTACSTW